MHPLHTDDMLQRYRQRSAELRHLADEHHSWRARRLRSKLSKDADGPDGRVRGWPHASDADRR